MQISKIVSFQPSSIYHHLRESLHKATTDAFPEHCQDLRSVPITFSCITPDPLTDIATPYPLKISWFLSLPVTTVTQRIIDCFQINSDYISTTKDTLFRNGFLNFSLSDTFLLRSVYETSISETESVSLPAGNIPEILKKIQILLQRFTPSEVPACDQFVIRPLPHSTPEHTVSRLIAITSLDGIHSLKTCVYFKRQLLDNANWFYKVCPVQTVDLQLSALRILIMKALYTRIVQLGHYSSCVL